VIPKFLEVSIFLSGFFSQIFLTELIKICLENLQAMAVFFKQFQINFNDDGVVTDILSFQLRTAKSP